jgi:hypothetical protein
MDETIETLQEKLNIYKQFFEKLAPTNTSSPPLGSLTPSPTSLAPAVPAVPAAPAAPAAPIFKPNKRYVKFKEILDLTGLKKNEYNNLLVRRKLIFKYFYYLLI